MEILPAGKSKADLCHPDNKETQINSILGLSVHHFRSIKDQSLKMGSVVTLLSGRNGTMKTSLMGLVAQVFDSPAKNAFSKPLKTPLSEVFKLSPDYDNDKYAYDVVLRLKSGEIMREPVNFYYVGHKTNRHRVVVSGSEQGDGTFTYNTSFLNLQRLYPIADTNAKELNSKTVTLSSAEADGIKDFYETVFPSSEYANFAQVEATANNRTTKTTFGPASDSMRYDWRTISSGEDNLGSIYNRLIGFERAKKKDPKEGNGVLCIDEFESTLHPVAQLRLFDYLFRWAKKNRVQIILTTHSLHLISHVYLKYIEKQKLDETVINFVSSSFADDNAYPILHNPPYDVAYTELTLEHPEVAAAARKIKVFCEDDVAIHFIKRIIRRQDVLRAVDFHCSLDPSSDNPGTSFTALSSICTKFPLLLENSIVIFDADISSDALKKIKKSDLYLILPDPQSLALERRVVAFIVNLKPSDKFFQTFKKSRTAFLDSFKVSGIKSLTLEDILDTSGDANKDPAQLNKSIEPYKRWAKSQKTKFNQYVTYYCNFLEGRDEFRESFVGAINKLNLDSGIPEVY